MTLTQLEYIIAVDKHKNFGKAADACFVTQPTLSMQIQKFEDAIGLVIFDRSKNPIVTTDEGEKIISQAEVVIQANKRIKEIAQDTIKEPTGTIKLGIIPTIAPFLVHLFAKNFSAKYKNIDLIIEECKTEDIIKRLDDDTLDAGILVTPLHDSNIIEKPLYYEPFYLFVSPNEELYNKNVVDEDDLDINKIWLLNKGNCFRDQVLNICSQKDKIKSENLKFESGCFSTLQNLVLSVSGYTILPKMAVELLPQEYKNHIRPFNKPVPIREVSIIHRRKFYKKRIINLLEKEVKANIPQELKEYNAENKEIIEIF